MANYRPPPTPAGAPRTTTITAHTVLYRVHQKAYDVHVFNPVPNHRYYGGGRFDSTNDDAYPFLYAGESVDVAVAETLLRDLAPDDTGMRVLPFARAANRRISAIRVQNDLELVSLLSGEDLGAVSQDPWLTTCDPRDYAQTRHWGHWIRTHAPTACGYVWHSRREPDARAYVLFGDRIPPGAISSTPSPNVPAGDAADFDTPKGRRALRNRLSRYGIALSRR